MNYHPAWHLKHAVIEKPYDVQIEALKRTRGHERYGWFLEQGLGKTALALNDYVENHSDLDTVVTICPSTFRMDWAAAPEEWGLPDIHTSAWGTHDLKKGTSSYPHWNSINFEAVRSSGYDHVKDLLDKRPCLLVVDESSAIKNFKSQTAKAVLDLCKRAKAVRLLNGTPLTQNVMDLFPQLKCLGELDRMNPYAFRNHFAVMGGWMGKQVMGVKNEKELYDIQHRVSFRALKKDWSDLPPKIWIPLRLEMTNRQRKHYKEMYEDFLTLVKGKEYSADLVLTQMDKLRQIASGILIDGDKHVLIEDMNQNPKAQAALDLMESGSGKMIVVHYYTKIGHELLEFFKEKGLNPSYIRGGMKSDELTAQKRKFNTDPSSRVLVAQITAANKAHTLLGGPGVDRCHKMLFHDQTFSLLDRKQMEDRNHRGAQDQDCLIYDPVMSPIDEAQLKAITTKGDMAALVVDAVRAMRGQL